MLIDIGPDRAVEFRGKRDAQTGRYVARQNGSQPSVEFGTSALGGTYTALENGAEVEIKTDLYDFGTGPARYITHGFGVGSLYSQEVGETLSEFFNCPFSNEQWFYERGDRTTGTRKLVQEDSGFRYTGFEGSRPTGSDYSQGNINWVQPAGGVEEGAYILVSQWVRRSVKGEFHQTDFGGSQYKTFRFHNDQFGGPDDAIVLYSNGVPNSTTVGVVSVADGETTVTGVDTKWDGLGSGGVGVIQLNGDGVWRHVSTVVSATELTLSEPYKGPNLTDAPSQALRRGQLQYTGVDNPMPTLSNGARIYMDDEWIREDAEIRTNTVGSKDGKILSRVIRPWDAGIEEVFPNHWEGNHDGDDLVELYEQDGPRIRWIMEQSYLNNTAGDLDIKQSDMFMQVGSLARFEIADAPTPDECSRSHILPPKEWVSPQQVKCHLWKGTADSFQGMYLHAYDHDGVFIGGVEL